MYLIQQGNLTGLCNFPNPSIEFRPKDGLLSEQPVQHTFNTLLPDIAYIVSVAAINNVGNGHKSSIVQTTAEEGTCLI